MSMIRKFFFATAGAALAASLCAASAQQADPVLAQAKALGVVGEMYTGYLGVADDSKATPDIKRRVEETNAKRLSLYTDAAQKQSETVANVAGVAAEKLMARAASSGEQVKASQSDPWKKQ